MKNISVPIFDFDITISFSDDEMLDMGFSIDGYTMSDVRVHEYKQDGSIHRKTVIYISFDRYDINTVCHESTHAAWCILNNASISVSSDDHVILSYLSGWIASQIEVAYHEHIVAGVTGTSSAVNLNIGD